MNYRVFLVVLLLFNALGVQAISSNDAINYVASSNHFLYNSEVYTPPNVTIGHNDTEFWVIPITAGNTIITYFPVDAKSGELSSSKSTNRALFKIADELKTIQSLKASISSNPSIDWIFTQKYQTIFNEMSLQLNDEVFQLNTVETTLNDEGVKVSLTSLKSELGNLSSDSLDISELISDASSNENDFITKPSQVAFDEMYESFDLVFEAISVLNSNSLSYQSNIDKLKQQISVADIDAQTKSQLFSVIEVPQGLQALRNYNLDATQVKETFESSLSTASLARDSLLGELSTRVLKNMVYDLIYSENEKIQKDTEFNSLFEAQQTILSSDLKGTWDNQSKVKLLEGNYSRALKYYAERNFEKSEEYAKLAISNALSVIKKGQVTQVIPPLFSQDFLFTVVGLLVLFLIILFLVNNKYKLSKGNEEDEVDVYG